MLARKDSILALAALALGLAACGDARPAVGGGGGGGGGGVCTTCHGTAGRVGSLPGTDANLASAPPAAPSGESAAVATAVIGAHQAHLNPPATGSLTGPLACANCHVVPTDISHATSPPAQIVQFSGLATTGSVSPTWNSTDKVNNTTCSNVYCHGNFTWNGVTGNTVTPDWTTAGQPACGSCHGIPPTNHIQSAWIVQNDPTTCNGCHPGTVDSGGNIIVNASTGASRHVNGAIDEGAHPDPSWLTASGGDHTTAALNQSPPFQSCLACHVSFGAADPNDVAGSSCNACHQATATTAGWATTNWQQNCVFCHGDASKIVTWTTADPTYEIAPPRGALGETSTAVVAVGAHQNHVNAGSGYNVLSNPIACTECHPSPLPADLTHVNGVVEVPLAGLLEANVLAGTPTWTASSASCSATYCHGNYAAGGTNATPIWTQVDGTFAACTSCHGAPPNTGQHYVHMFSQSTNCSDCHNGIATGSGSSAPVTNAAIVGSSSHVNGTVNVQFSAYFVSLGAQWTAGGTPPSGTCSNIACHGSIPNSKGW